jgi:hypothetical protein
MKKVIFFSLLTLLTVTFLSCKKETASKNSPGIFPGKVRSIHYTGTEGTGLYQNPNTTEYYYNPDGSIHQIVFLDSALQLIGTEDFTYSNSKILAIQLDKNSGESIHYSEYQITASNIADSVSRGISSSKITSCSKFVYDAAGRVIEEKIRFVDILNSTHTLDSGSFIYTYNNGNLVQYESPFQPQIHTFEYSDINCNTSRSQVELGQYDRSEKLVTRAFVHTAANPQRVLTYTVAYTFDSSNRVATETTQYYHLNGIDPGGSITRAFTYW